MKITRRGFIAGVGTAALAGPVSAIHTTKQPSHVTLEFNEDKLEKYKPLLVTRNLEVIPDALYGQWTTSDERDTDVAVYWAEYPFQRGVSRIDSHFGDHEPIYVFVDSDDGSVQKVIYTGYHWLKATSTTPKLLNDEKPKFVVVKRWHHYRETTEEGVNIDLKDLTSEFQSWLDNGMEDDLQPGTVVDPWTMEDRGYWWKDNRLGFSGRALFAGVKLRFGLEGGNDTDL